MQPQDGLAVYKFSEVVDQMVPFTRQGLRAFLQAADGQIPTFPPTGWTFTVNSDGQTVTVAGTGTVPTP